MITFKEFLETKNIFSNKRHNRRRYLIGNKTNDNIYISTKIEEDSEFYVELYLAWHEFHMVFGYFFSLFIYAGLNEEYSEKVIFSWYDKQMYIDIDEHIITIKINFYFTEDKETKRINYFIVQAISDRKAETEKFDTIAKCKKYILDYINEKIS